MSSNLVTRALNSIDDRIGRGWLRLRGLLGVPPAIQVRAYDSYGTQDRWWLQGRVVARRPLDETGVDTPRWRNLLAVLRRFTTVDLPGGIVAVSAARDGDADGGGDTDEVRATTDNEGYWKVELDAPRVTGGDTWHELNVRLLRPRTTRATSVVRTTGHVLVPHPDATLAVVSDLDDTVIRTGLTQGLKAVRITLLNNAHTRVPFGGVGAFYRALAAGEDGGSNPVFYLSGSPWTLEDLLRAFLRVHELPRGPLLLSDWGLDPGRWFRGDTDAFKVDHIERLLGLYPTLRFVLIGDSGQGDPETYAEVVTRHPDRISAVYLRDVSEPGRDAEVQPLVRRIEDAGVPVVMSPDTVPAAEHAAGLGLIGPDAVEAVRAERDAAASTP